MEAKRTLARALAAAPHGGSASSGGITGGHMQPPAAKSALQSGEPIIEQQMKGFFGGGTEWVLQRWFAAEEVIIEAKEPGVAISIEVARLDGRQLDPPQAMNASFIDYVSRLVTDREDLREFGMAVWFWSLYKFYYLNRTKTAVSFTPRSYVDEKSLSKEYRAPLPTGGLGARAVSDKFQIFINMPSGNPLLVWVNALEPVGALWANLAKRMGYHAQVFYLVHEGKTLQDSLKLSDYQISRNSSISMLFRLRGGAEGKQGGTFHPHKGTGPSSYKDAARPKGPQTFKADERSKRPQTEATPPVSPSSPYIVEKLDTIPSLEVKNSQVKKLFSQLQTHAIICRFNGYWPRSFDLHEWVYTNWTVKCQLLLCSKGFFVVQFELLEDYQKVFEQGPWFWGRAGLFITPWFPDFDANTMVVTKMPVWVRLPNLPLPFWHPSELEDIGNLLGTYVKCDNERREQGLFTYARICVEIDLSIGLPDRIRLIYEKYNWMQVLDYENTAFRCRTCQMTGHLQDMCPLAKKFPKKKKGTNTRRKTWQADYDPFSDEEETGEGEQISKEENEEKQKKTETEEAQNAEQKSACEETQSDPGNNMDESPGKGTQSAIVIHEEAPISGTKRGHESEKSDSDKELPSKQTPEVVNGRQVIVATPSHGRWVEVKNKKKGKKGKIEAYYQP